MSVMHKLVAFAGVLTGGFVIGWIFLDSWRKKKNKVSLSADIPVCSVEEVDGETVRRAEGLLAPPPTRTGSSLALQAQDTSALSSGRESPLTPISPPSPASMLISPDSGITDTDHRGHNRRRNRNTSDRNTGGTPPPSRTSFCISTETEAEHTPSRVLSDEFVAAVSLTLGSQGFEIADEEESEPDSDSDMTDVSFLGSSSTTDYSLLGSSNGQSLANSADIAQLSHTAGQPPSLSDKSPPSSDEIRTTFTSLESSVQDMTREDADVLTRLLSSRDPDILDHALIYIGNAAAFTRNQDLLREVGCLPALSALIAAHGTLLAASHSSLPSPGHVTRILRTINNLAANENNQKHLQECIPALFEFASHENNDSAVKLSSLQALTNLSVTPSYHAPYTAVIQRLYEQLDDVTDTAVRNQALRVLVNLSTNADMAPHLLAAKAPICLMSLLSPETPDTLLLPWVTFLGNVMSEAGKQGVTSTTLPTQYKAASPETMFTAIHGVGGAAKLKSRVFVLNKHSNTEVRTHATRIYALV